MQPFSFTLPPGVDFRKAVTENSRAYKASESVAMMNGVLFATTTRIAAVLPIMPPDAPAMEPMLLPANVLRTGRRPAEVRVSDQGVSVHPLPKQSGDFQPLGAVMPPRLDGMIEVALDVVFLKHLCDAIAPSGQVSLYIMPGTTKPVVVIGHRTEGEYACGIGCIVPLATHAEQSKERERLYAELRAKLPQEKITFGAASGTDLPT